MAWTHDSRRSGFIWIIRELPESESQRLIDLVMAIPLSTSLFVVGLLLMMTGLNLGDRSVRRDLEARFPRQK